MKKPLSKAIKMFYGIGDMGFSLMTSVEIYFFVFFLTNIAQYSLVTVAIIGSVTSIVDAVLSPIYGGIISGMKPMKWGRNRSWLLVGPPLVVILYVFQYTRIGPEAVAAVIVCAGFILSHITWNIGWVASVSMISVLANNPEERALLSSHRSMYTSMAGIFFSYIATPLAVFFGMVVGSETMGYGMLAGFMALIMMIGYWIVFRITKGYEPTGAEEKVAATTANRVTLIDMLKSAGQNPHLIVLLISDFFRYISGFILGSAAAYYFTYVVQNMALFPLYLLIGAVGQLVGSYISAPLAKKLTTRTASLVGLLGLTASLIICRLVATNTLLFFIVISFARMFTGSVGATNVALYADVAIYSEWKTGKNATPFVMGLMNLALKTAIISRGTVIPFALATAGFVAGVDPALATDTLKNAVMTVFLLFPGIMAGVAFLILITAFRLTHEKVLQYQAEIDARNVAV